MSYEPMYFEPSVGEEQYGQTYSELTIQKVSNEGSNDEHSMVSRPGNLNSFGGEMLTRAPEGAVMGLAIGGVLGLILACLLSSRAVEFHSLDRILSIGPIFFTLISVILSGAAGAFWGTLIGIGVPKFNPHPKQGLVKHWKKVEASEKNETIFVPTELRIETATVTSSDDQNQTISEPIAMKDFF